MYLAKDFESRTPDLGKVMVIAFGLVGVVEEKEHAFQNWELAVHKMLVVKLLTMR
jgi:hypothetical protein